MQELNPSYMPRHYKSQLDWILSTFEDLVERQGQPNDVDDRTKIHGRGQSLDAMPNQVHDSSVSISPDMAFLTPEFSQTQVARLFTTSSTSLKGDGIATDSFALRSPAQPPTDHFGDFSSNFSSNVPKDAPPLAPSPNPTVRSCVHCGRVFRGARDSKTNLKRHVTQFHDGNWKHACKVPGCGRIFARADYLQIHCEKFHDPPVRATTRRRKSKPDSTQGLQTHDFLHRG